MNERQICCCGASGWTRVIAWFQIIGSIISVIVMAVAIDAARDYLDDYDGIKRRTISLSGSYLQEVSDVTKMTHVTDGTAQIPDMSTVLDEAAGAAMRKYVLTVLYSSIILLICSILECIMGFILLRGSLEKNTYQIQLWIVYTVTSLAAWVTMNLIKCVFAPTASEVASALNQVISVSIIQGFCLWVVRTHKKEIEASGGSVFPVNV